MRRFVLAIGVLGLAACGDGAGPGDGGTGPAVDPADTGTASLAFTVTAPPDFKCNSVRICADRVHDADGKYPCKSHVCECFNFDTNGTPVRLGGDEARMENLCPSADYPVSDWDFTYEIWSGPYCLGEVLTSVESPFDFNFTCYALDDLTVQSHPNAEREPLLVGENFNEIVCLTTNSSKGFDFDVCIDDSTYEDKYLNRLRLDCGCMQVPLGTDMNTVTNETVFPDVDPYGNPIEKECRCFQQFELPLGCGFSDDCRCDIVCEGGMPQ